MPRFMDIRQDLKLPAGASAQIAGDTGQARADRSGARQLDPCQNPRGVHYLPGRARRGSHPPAPWPCRERPAATSARTGSGPAGRTNGADLAGLQVRGPSLEDIYLSLTQTRKEASGAFAVSGRGAPAHPAGSTARLAWHQFRYDLRAFLRNRRARFFTLALPVLFLVIFASVLTGTTKVAGGPIGTPLCYVPGIITLAIISAAFGNQGPRPGPYFYTLEVV